MSTRRIAEVTGKSHDIVLRDARKALENCEINLIRFEQIDSTRAAKGNILPVFSFYFPKDISNISDNVDESTEKSLKLKFEHTYSLD